MASSWFLPSVLAVLLWGVSMFLPRLALKTLPPLHLAVYSAAFYFLATVIVLFFYDFQIDFNMKGAMLGVAAGMLGMMAQVFYTFAVRQNSMAFGVVVTSLYPVVATLMAFLLLGETLTLRQTGGIFLGLCPLVLLVMANGKRS